MKNYNRLHLESYLKTDWILDLLNENMNEQDKLVRTNQWLYDIEPKRMIYSDIYGDLIHNGGKKVLDVGGGYNSLSKIIASKNDYTLLDFMAHGGNDYLNSISHKYGIRWINDDWYVSENVENYDIVIANDIFPDVDQRLELFIDKMRPKCKEIRLVITYYNNPMFYTSKRVDDSEVLTFLSWDGEITSLKLKKYFDYLVDTSSDELDYMIANKESLYWNGRQVSSVVIKGMLD